MSYSSGLHGLTGVPRMVNVVLRCIGADIMAVGEESDISGWFNASQLSPAFQVKRSVTQIIVELAGNPLVGNEGDYVVGSGGGLLNPVSFNNYALRFYAWY
jgi:hypothetical protein